MTELIQQLQQCISTQTNSNGDPVEAVDTITAIKLIIQILEQMNA